MLFVLFLLYGDGVIGFIPIAYFGKGKGGGGVKISMCDGVGCGAYIESYNLSKYWKLVSERRTRIPGNAVSRLPAL